MELFVEVYVRDARPPGKRNKNGRRKLHGGTKAVLADTPTYLRFEGRGASGAMEQLTDWLARAESAEDSIRRRLARCRVIAPGDEQFERAKKAWQRSR